MKKLLLVFWLALCAVQARAEDWSRWHGKLNLDLKTVSPIIARELNDGQWLAGIDFTAWTLYRNDLEILHVGIFQAWNAEHGNTSTGLTLGRNTSVGKVLGPIAKRMHLDNYWKPTTLLGAIISLDGFLGYRPQHAQDVQGNLVYGALARLSIPFSVEDLKKGW